MAGINRMVANSSSRAGRKIGKANNSRVAGRTNRAVINSDRPIPTRDWLVELQTCPLRRAFFWAAEAPKYCAITEAEALSVRLCKQVFGGCGGHHASRPTARRSCREQARSALACRITFGSLRRPVLFWSEAAVVEAGQTDEAFVVAVAPTSRAATRARLNAHKPCSRTHERRGYFRAAGQTSKGWSDHDSGRIERPDGRRALSQTF